MGLFLNFGAGPNQLPEPWQNLNAEHDIRKPLKFDDGSVSFILAEHVIEHVPFLQGVGFVRECLRVLEPEGVLRLAFPDISRFVASSLPGAFSGEMKYFDACAKQYADALGEHHNPRALINPETRTPGAKILDAMTSLLVGWHHQCAWTLHSAAGVLLANGFRCVTELPYGRSDVPELDGVDGHHRDVGHEIAQLETTVLEAIK